MSSMKLKYSICYGLDVHKNLIVATIVTTNNEGLSEYQQLSFSTTNSDIRKFYNWLSENNCYHVCMESTRKYWIPIFNYLKNDIDVCLSHPKCVKTIKSKKTTKGISNGSLTFINLIWSDVLLSHQKISNSFANLQDTVSNWSA